MDFNALIDAARGENAHGIEVRRGKKYTSAAVRVELMRRHLGALGIETEIVQWAAEKGAPIVIRATIRDEAGRVLATGHAEEIRGAGNINTTSALENAETSAIGRALAALGISGGEFASANEMDGVERKAAALADEGPSRHEIAAAVDAINACADVPALADYWRKLSADMKAIAKHPAVIEAKDARKVALAEIFPPN